MRSGDKARTNRMFRRRIYAQGFTILAMLGGSAYWESDRAKRGQFDELTEEKRRKEKKDAWIRELEVRDAEEDELRRIRDNLVRGRTAERVGLSEGAARKAEEDAMAARKRGGAGGDGSGSGVLSALEKGEGRGEGSVLEAVRGLWRR